MAADEPDPPLDSVRPKLVETKRRWAGEGRLLTGRAAGADRPRLPPGQHQVRDWPVLDLGIQPAIDLGRWSLVVDGLVERPFTWDWAAFAAQPHVEDVSDMHCVTAWSRFDNRWHGVPARAAVLEAGPQAAARFAVLHGADGYSTNLPLAALMDDDVLLADRWEGAPLAREHGGPVRALIPRLYLWKSAKWLTRIELIAEDRRGFWEERGYHDHGDPWLEERYS